MPPVPSPLSLFLESSKKGSLPSPSQVLTTWTWKPLAAGAALPDRGPDGGLSRAPPVEGGGWEEAGEILAPEVLPSLPGFSPRGVGSHGSGSLCPTPTPVPGRAGPAVPTGEQQCQASRPGSGPRTGARASGNSHRGSPKPGPGALSPLPPGYPHDPQSAGAAGQR